MAYDLNSLESLALPEQAHGVVAEEVDEGLLLLRDDGRYLVINHTAAFIWRNLPSAGNFAEMVRGVSAMRGAPGPRESLEIVKTFLDELKQEGFVRERN